jgi:hypothetical protein
MAGFFDFFTGSQAPFRADGTFDPDGYRRGKAWDSIGSLSEGLIAFGLGQPAQAAQAWGAIGKSDRLEPFKLQALSAQVAKAQAAAEADAFWSSAVRGTQPSGPAAAAPPGAGMSALPMSGGMSPGAVMPQQPQDIAGVIASLPPAQRQLLAGMPRADPRALLMYEDGGDARRLIPRVDDAGRVMSDEQALAQYQQTGRVYALRSRRAEDRHRAARCHGGRDRGCRWRTSRPADCRPDLRRHDRGSRLMNATMARRLDRVERMSGSADAVLIDGLPPLSRWTLADLYLALDIGSRAAADLPADWQPFVAGLDVDERKRREHDERPDHQAAIASNVAAGHCRPRVPRCEALRWPALVAHALSGSDSKRPIFFGDDGMPLLDLDMLPPLVIEPPVPDEGGTVVAFPSALLQI